MVGGLGSGNNPGQSSNNTSELLLRVTHNHNIDPQAIRDLIKGALDLLPVDPIPTRILISDIVITRNPTNVQSPLELRCQVSYQRGVVV